MRLFYHPASTNSRRVLLAAHHLGHPIDLVLVDLFKRENTSPDFFKINPNQKVPVLEHDGFVLWESYAIMQYLADLSPDQTIYPRDIKARADINRWLFWCGQHFMPGIEILNWENAIKSLAGKGAADPAEVARGERLLLEAAQILDGHLATREWICGTELSLADFAIAAPLADYHRAKLPVTGFKNIYQWFRRVQALAAWRSAEKDSVD